MIEMIVRFDNIQFLKPFNNNNKRLQSEEKIFTVHTVDRGLICRIYKNSYKSNRQKKKTQRTHTNQ